MFRTEMQKLVDIAKRLGMALVNTIFQKRMKHRESFRNRGMSTQIDCADVVM